jgi:hypothetical protein
MVERLCWRPPVGPFVAAEVPEIPLIGLWLPSIGQNGNIRFQPVSHNEMRLLYDPLQRGCE